jgi:hypothetical protein
MYPRDKKIQKKHVKTTNSRTLFPIPGVTSHSTACFQDQFPILLAATDITQALKPTLPFLVWQP